MIRKPSIDRDFLLRHVTALDPIKRKRLSWNDFGEKLAWGLASRPRMTLAEIGDRPELIDTPHASAWSAAKKHVHAALTSDDLRYADIQKRLGSARNTSTPILLSTLSMWLAGEMSISISVTRPMVAAMLYAVAHSSDDWEIFRDA